MNLKHKSQQPPLKAYQIAVDRLESVHSQTGYYSRFLSIIQHSFLHNITNSANSTTLKKTKKAKVSG